jgi:hypothetical protein
MPRGTLIWFAAIVAITPSALSAQDAAPAIAAPCSYDTCALRVEQGRILRGIASVRVGRLGAFSATRLSPLVIASDSAQRYAAAFDQHYGPGMRWAAVGGIGLGVVTVVVLDPSERQRHSDGQWRGRDWGLLAGLLVSIGASEYGRRRVERARRALSRSVWWHNRELGAAR